ncbi:MAG: sulfotransferase [Candidatus Acididesulfobacter diazotrophicus]|jgi:hypothetical protein|uniref:Sulfotransferase n=1 Tax=Candidatus Acididesulfobacter diazotrophicus TaxID=2597226 RepID=A0A519BK40_9DELT|nr:MAG: sulfotransferase [Candidatus Acididesulfobacter diazotrophicus]
MKNYKSPNFLGVGAAKSGTTSLFQWLLQHPDVYVPEIKECRFFSQMPNDAKGLGSEMWTNGGIRNEKDYFDLFKEHENQICGDISPDYLYYYEKSIANIKKFLSNDVKIIIVLRNPIERAYSFYFHLIRDGVENCSFEEAIIKEPYRIKEGWAWSYHYIRSGMYYKQVKAYIENFKNIKIYIFEDLLKGQEFMNDIFEFIGIKTIPIDFDKFNESGYPKSLFLSYLINKPNIFRKIAKPFLSKELKSIIYEKIRKYNLSKINKIPLKIETKTYLREVYSKDITKLSNLIQRDLTMWLE